MAINCDNLKNILVESSKSRSKTVYRDNDDILNFARNNLNIHLNSKSDVTKNLEIRQVREETSEKINVTYRHKYHPTLLSTYFWYLISICGIVTIDINLDYKGKGTDLEISSFDAFIMLISTHLLMKSFQMEKSYLSIPWVFTTLWSIYSCQYLSLVQIKRSNLYTEHPINIAMWIAYGQNIFFLAMRFILWAKVCDFLFATDFFKVLTFWSDVIEYLTKRMRTVRTMMAKNVK